ncbi:hypothetical protein [Ferruginibacter sp.]|nr:hypothetical protein [Ferruginibacter sp.]
MKKQNFIEFEVSNALKDGFTHQFSFKDGVLTYGIDPILTFLPQDVIKERKPCVNSENIIYRITTKNNIKGFLIVPRYGHEEALPFT